MIAVLTSIYLLKKEKIVDNFDHVQNFTGVILVEVQVCKVLYVDFS